MKELMVSIVIVTVDHWEIGRGEEVSMYASVVTTYDVVNPRVGQLGEPVSQNQSPGSLDPVAGSEVVAPMRMIFRQPVPSDVG